MLEEKKKKGIVWASAGRGQKDRRELEEEEEKKIQFGHVKSLVIQQQTCLRYPSSTDAAATLATLCVIILAEFIRFTFCGVFLIIAHCWKTHTKKK